jgi:hypothetical protein
LFGHLSDLFGSLAIFFPVASLRSSLYFTALFKQEVLFTLRGLSFFQRLHFFHSVACLTPCQGGKSSRGMWIASGSSQFTHIFWSSLINLPIPLRLYTSLIFDPLYRESAAYLLQHLTTLSLEILTYLHLKHFHLILSFSHKKVNPLSHYLLGFVAIFVVAIYHKRERSIQNFFRMSARSEW